MNKEFIARHYQPGDEQGIVNLLQLGLENWAKREAPVDYWKWRYCDTPIKYLISLVISDDMIVGVNHNYINYLKMGTTNVLTYFTEDVVTHPKYRGMGIYSKIVDLNTEYFEKNEFKFGYWLSSNPIIIKDNIKRMRKTFPHPISYMVRIKDIGLHLQKRPEKHKSMLRLGYSALTTLNKIENTITAQHEPIGDYSIEEVKNFDERIDVFWDNVRGSYDFIFENNHEVLNWRYRDPRGGDFVVMEAVKDGVVLGFIALKLTRLDSYLEGFVMDLLALPGRLDVVYVLLREGCDYFDRLGVNAVYYMVVDGHPYQEISKKLEFVDSRRKPNIGCHVYDTKSFEVLRSSSPDRIYLGYAETQ